MPGAAVRAASRAAIASGPLMIAAFRLSRAEWIAPEIPGTGIGSRTPPTWITMHAGSTSPIEFVVADFKDCSGVLAPGRHPLRIPLPCTLRIGPGAETIIAKKWSGIVA